MYKFRRNAECMKYMNLFFQNLPVVCASETWFIAKRWSWSNQASPLSEF